MALLMETNQTKEKLLWHGVMDIVSGLSEHVKFILYALWTGRYKFLLYALWTDVIVSFLCFMDVIKFLQPGIDKKNVISAAIRIWCRAQNKTAFSDADRETKLWNWLLNQQYLELKLILKI